MYAADCERDITGGWLPGRPAGAVKSGATGSAGNARSVKSDTAISAARLVANRAEAMVLQIVRKAAP